MWKIAIIDDDFQVLEGLRKAIPWAKLGAEWSGEATNGAIGLELVTHTEPDIILTDIYMPVMDGLDMIRKLREQHYEGQIIILSGYSDFHYARQALQLRVCDYLCKPITVRELSDVLQSAISRLEEERRAKTRYEEICSKLSRYETIAPEEEKRPPDEAEYRESEELILPKRFTPGKHKEMIEYVIRYVNEHCAEDMTLGHLAARFYLSKNYLNYLFKCHTGETLTNYIIRVRMEKARRMILEGRHLIYEIAEKVGYRNVPYFSYVFKKTFGVNPSELVRK